MAKRYFWLKLKEDFFQHKALKKLRSIAGGDTYTIIYLKLMLKALPEEGRLYFDRIEETFYEELALDIDEEPENVRITIAFLERRGLVELVNEETMLMPYVKAATGSETSGAKRVREYRSRRKALQSNAPVTLLQQSVNGDIDIEKDIDIDTDKENNTPSKDGAAARKKKTDKKPGEVFAEMVASKEILEALNAYADMRKKKRNALTAYAATLLVNKLNKLSQDEGEQLEMINNAIQGGWSSVYPLDKGGSNGKVQRNLAGSQGGKGRRRYEYESDQRKQELLNAWNDE